LDLGNETHDISAFCGAAAFRVISSFTVNKHPHHMPRSSPAPRIRAAPAASATGAKAPPTERESAWSISSKKYQMRINSRGKEKEDPQNRFSHLEKEKIC